MCLEQIDAAGASPVAVACLKSGHGLADSYAECAGEHAAANRTGRKGKGEDHLTYYPDADSEEPAFPEASRAEKGALFAMCVLIPFLTAANCSLFSRGIYEPTLAPTPPQCGIQLAALRDMPVNRRE
jgi:hypothetical protein